MGCLSTGGATSNRRQLIAQLLLRFMRCQIQSEAVKDAIIRLWVAEDMHVTVTWPMVLHVDNAAGESFQHSTCGVSKLKGVFNLREAWVRELKDEGLVNAVHVDTTKNLADMLTKGLKAEVRNQLENYLLEISKRVAKCA